MKLRKKEGSEKAVLFYNFFPVWKRIVIEYAGMEILEKEPICMDKLYIVIPAYNEEANIERTVKEWYPVIQRNSAEGESRLVVVNDGSKDSTWEILCRLKKEMPLLEPLKKKNGGHGSSVLYGYNYAVEQGADYVFQTDADGQTNPEEFEEFWDLKEKYDVIIGSRSVRGDGKSRKFVENVVCILLRIIFGIKVRDANAPFRLMRAELLEKYIKRLPKDYNLPNIMLTTYFVYYQEKVCFREISFKPRQGGVNSLNLKKIVKIGWRAMGDFRRLRKEM